MGFITTEVKVNGKEFYKSVDEDGGMNGVSYSPIFKSDVVNVIYRNKEAKREYRAWLKRVQTVLPKPEAEFRELMEESKKPFAVNYFGRNGRVYVATKEEAFALCDAHTIKVVGGGFGNK